MKLRVATFNIRTSSGPDGRDGWRHRRDTCLTVINDFAADVVGLQEVRPDQLADLRAAFPDNTVLGRGRDEDGGGEHAAIMVRAGGWQIESTSTRWLSPTPTAPGSRGWDAELPRVVTMARLRRDDVRLGVANTHFDHRGARARQHSAELIGQWLAADLDRPWVVLGDLNTEPDTTPIRTLAGVGLRDTLPVDAGGTEHEFTGATDRTRIDYVLIGTALRSEGAWIAHPTPGGRLPSDHWPVVADLIVAATPPAPTSPTTPPR